MDISNIQGKMNAGCSLDSLVAHLRESEGKSCMLIISSFYNYSCIYVCRTTFNALHNIAIAMLCLNIIECNITVILMEMQLNMEPHPPFKALCILTVIV